MSFVTSADGTRIYYEVHGEGEPILLVMGLGSNIHGWYRTIPWLLEQGRWQVIALDNRGVGRSDVPDGPYTTEQMSDDAAAVLDAAGVATTHLMGASLGGMISQRFAVRHPHRLRSLVLLCTTPGGEMGVKASPEVIEALLAGGDDPAEAYRNRAWILYSEQTRAHGSAAIEEDLVHRLKIPTTPAGYMNQFLASAGHDVWDELESISVPTLVVHGADDLLIPPENSRLIASRIPGAVHVEIPGAGHMLQADAPDQVREALEDFFDRVLT